MAFLIIVTCELILLFRLGLPRLIAFGQSRYDQHYGVADAERAVRLAESPSFHDALISTEAQRYHG